MEFKNSERRDFLAHLLRTITTAGAVLYAPELLAKESSATVRAVSLRNGKDSQRMIIALDRPVKHKLFTLSSPDRVVLDIKSVDANGKLILNNDRPTSLVSRMRYATRNDSDLRLVLDMSDAAKAKSMVRKTKNGYQLEITLSNPALAGTKPEKQPVAKQEAKQRGSKRKFIVAIDAGHGGRDSGAVGKLGTYEKDVVLQISRRLRKKINRTKDMQAFLTRDKDQFLSLRTRIKRARAKHADLFISIHADANPNNTVTGSSVYVLSEKGASSEMAYVLARSENGADLEMAGSLQKYNPVLSRVLVDLTQSAAMDDSLDLAKGVLAELGNVNRLARKRVESANFGVLRSPDIPSMLVETAFISNPREERKLRTSHYQEKLAKAMYRGIARYKVALEGRDPRYATGKSPRGLRPG